MLCALTTQGGITLFGYFAGSIRLVGDGRSISLFVSRVALPCLLMRSLAVAKLDDLNYCFLFAMLLSKFLTLVLGGAIGSRLLSGPRLKSAAIGGLLSSCSNDLAFGLPIVHSLYPELEIYVVLLALMQNALLNQLCFILMEAGIAMEKGGGSRSDTLKAIVYGVATNALVVAPLVGLLINALFSSRPPLALDRLLGTVGEAFSCTSLFALGMSLATPPPAEVGHLALPDGRGWACVILFALLKLVVLPVVASRLEIAIGCSSASASAGALADVAYIYGSLPPAPWISVFATTTKHHPKVVARTLAVGLIAAFPLLLAGSLTLASGEEKNEHAALVFSSVCHGLSLIGTALLLLPVAVSAAMRRIAAAQGLPGGVLTLSPPTCAWMQSLARFLSVHMRLSPSVWMLTWLQLGFSSAALLGRGDGAWTGIMPGMRNASSVVWYTITNCCRLGAAIACVAVVRASSRRKAASSFAARKRAAYFAAGLLVTLALTLPFALNPREGSECDMWIQGGVPQLAVDLVFDLCVGVGLCLMARRLLTELVGSRARIGSSTDGAATLHSSTSAGAIALSPLSTLAAAPSNSALVAPSLMALSGDSTRDGSVSESGVSDVDSVGLTPLTARALLSDDVLGSNSAFAGGGVEGVATSANSPQPARSFGGVPLSPKGWREVAVALAAALRLTLDVVTIAAELSLARDSVGEAPMARTAARGRSLLVMRLLSMTLTDGQGFLTFIIFAPRFVVAAAPYTPSVASAIRRSSSAQELSAMLTSRDRSASSPRSPSGLSRSLTLGSLGKVRRVRSDTNLPQLEPEAEHEAATPYASMR